MRKKASFCVIVIVFIMGSIMISSSGVCLKKDGLYYNNYGAFPVLADWQSYDSA